MIVCDPNDFALITALYRSSVDGRRFMYEAILSEDGEYNIPDYFTSRTAEILQVYLKSLGVKMETVDNDDNFIGEPEHETEIVTFAVGTDNIQCTTEQMYYLRKINKVYQQWLKEHPNLLDEPEEVWDYIIDNLPFKRKYLTEEIMNIFKSHMQAFCLAGKDL